MNDDWNPSTSQDDWLVSPGGKSHFLAHLLLWLAILFVVLFILWARVASLDEVTVGEGKVIPSGQIQVVQNLEGGILSELLVREGDMVEKGQMLLRIDDTQFRSNFQENRVRMLSLMAKAARLEAELAGQPYEVPAAVKAEAPRTGENEAALFRSRAVALNSATQIIQQQVEQKRNEVGELRANRAQLARRLELARKELNITQPMVKQGIMSEVELLRLQREVSELEGSLEGNTLAIPRVEAALEEARRKMDEPRITFRNEAQSELNKTRDELNSLEEGVAAIKDKVVRTSVRSPVKGTIIRVKVNTLGQVVRSGMDLVEILPAEETLLIEARINPKDIGFLRPGLQTTVKFSAYDFAIYGGLVGQLEQISPDAIANEKGESHYLIQVRTKANRLGGDENPLPIIPGMVATVDILTGKKTVLDYLLKPILKAKAVALRER
ncbi:MAG: HlyD family type I secretion periplasmic adaptor subunit [Magnetococcales bacterium]|nr:HlyD family type I secretion periplasmic adaptor subunit [Magnetococcales bacterium]